MSWRRVRDVEPWERQARESEARWRAFKVYRDMGDQGERSLRKVAAAVGKSYELVSRWSTRDSWVDRVTAYDNEMERAALAARRKDVAAFRKRAAEQLRAKIQTLMLPAIALSKKIAMAGGSADVLAELTPHQLMRLAILSARAMPAAIRAEALVLGDVTGREEHVTEVGGAEPDALEIAIKADPDARTLIAMAVERATSGRASES